jgi:hypothetical protein
VLVGLIAWHLLIRLLGVPVGCEQANRWTGEHVNRCPSRNDRSTRGKQAWNEILILVTRIQCFDYLPESARDTWMLNIAVLAVQYTTDRLLVSVRPTAEQELPFLRLFRFRLPVQDVFRDPDHWLLSSIFPPLCYLTDYSCSKEARGGAVGQSTALQAGGSRVRFPMGSLRFFIYLILSALCSSQPVT